MCRTHILHLFLIQYRCTTYRKHLYRMPVSYFTFVVPGYPIQNGGCDSALYRKTVSSMSSMLLLFAV